MLTILAILGISLLGLGASTAHLTASAERAFPPGGQILTVQGRQVHVIDTGPAQPDPRLPPLVFIHGAFGAAEDFAVSIIPELARRYRCIAIDRPGHGYSARQPDSRAGTTPLTPDLQAEILRATLQALEVGERPVLVGFSLGAAVALAWGLEHPDEIAGLMLINPASHPWPTPVETSYEMPAWPLVGPLLLHTIVTPAGHLMKNAGARNVFSPAPVPEIYARAPVALALRPGSYAANSEDIRSLKAFLHRQAPRYPELQPPLTILASDTDNAASPIIHARPLAAQVPNSVMVETPGGGHPLHFSRPEAVIQAIEDLVDRVRR